MSTRSRLNKLEYKEALRRHAQHVADKELVDRFVRRLSESELGALVEALCLDAKGQVLTPEQQIAIEQAAASGLFEAASREAEINFPDFTDEELIAWVEDPSKPTLAQWRAARGGQPA